jgi:hypothetical protein
MVLSSEGTRKGNSQSDAVCVGEYNQPHIRIPDIIRGEETRNGTHECLTVFRDIIEAIVEKGERAADARQ